MDQLHNLAKRLTWNEGVKGTGDASKKGCPVAGHCTRFLPATKAFPKEMLPLIDKSLVQYVVEEAVAAD